MNEDEMYIEMGDDPYWPAIKRLYEINDILKTLKSTETHIIQALYEELEQMNRIFNASYSSEPN